MKELMLDDDPISYEEDSALVWIYFAKLPSLLRQAEAELDQLPEVT